MASASIHAIHVRRDLLLASLGNVSVASKLRAIEVAAATGSPGWSVITLEDEERLRAMCEAATWAVMGA